VQATIPGLDAVGSCVGLRGLRIQNIVNELAGEKIDVVEWDTNLARYISNALSPAKVQAVLLDESGAIKTATVVVPDRQLSLAIGKEGQNARLAAKLTGWRIDIKSDSEARTEGLDRVIADRAQEAAIKATEDLLAKAERILRSEGDEVEDRLLQAAQALRSGETVEAPEILPGEFKSFEELLAEVSESDQPKHFGESAFIAEEMGGGVPSAPDGCARMADNPLRRGHSAFRSGLLRIGERLSCPRDAAPAESRPTDAGQEQLPEVITADMLRARMAERKKFAFSEEDFEVPAELLAGYEAEEAEDDLFDASGKGKGKGAKGKSAKGKPAAKAKSKKPAAKRGWGSKRTISRPESQGIQPQITLDDSGNFSTQSA
jgi:transcription antitermination factor NusA-like protein